MTKSSILQTFEFYRDGSPEERTELLQAATYVRLPGSVPFYQQGDACGSFALVGRGDVRVFTSAACGRNITLYHVRDGEPCLINMLSVFLDVPAMASATTQIDTEAVIVPAALFRRWIATKDGIRRFVFTTMAARLVEVMTLVQEVALRRMDGRLASLLLRKSAAQGHRTIRQTHDVIAEELGTAREVVSRLLKELEHAGAVRLGRSQIAILDEQPLLDLAPDSLPILT